MTDVCNKLKGVKQTHRPQMGIDFVCQVRSSELEDRRHFWRDVLHGAYYINVVKEGKNEFSFLTSR